MAPARNWGRNITYDEKLAPETEASRRQARALVGKLGADERRLLEWIVDGHSLAAAAKELGVPLDDAIRLKAALLSKLGGSTTADLVRVGLYAEVGAAR